MQRNTKETRCLCAKSIKVNQKFCVHFGGSASKAQSVNSTVRFDDSPLCNPLQGANKEGFSDKVVVRTGDPNKNGTSVYHGGKTMLYVDIWLNGRGIDVKYYTGCGNHHLFPQLKECQFRGKGKDGGFGYPLTMETLETHKKYARLSAAIMDAE